MLMVCLLHLLMRQLKIDALSALVVTDKWESLSISLRATASVYLSPRSGRHIHSAAAASEGVASERCETRRPEPLVNEKNNQSPDVRSGRQPVTPSCLGGASAETEGRKPGDGKVRP